MIASEGPPEQPGRWPRVLGNVGLVVGVVIILDKLDDLVISRLWSGEDWARWLDPETAELVARVMASPWVVVSGLAGTALGVFLIVASLRLRNRRRSGVSFSIRWAWLALGWALLEALVAARWLARWAEEMPSVPQGSWACGTIAALAVMTAYPVFLLVWLSRGSVERQHADWEG